MAVKLIFETTHDHAGNPIKHRAVRHCTDGVVSSLEEDEYEHTWLVLRGVKSRRVIARMWEIGAQWNVGDYSYSTLRIVP